MIRRAFWCFIVISTMRLFKCETCTIKDSEPISKNFPADFLWGAGSSAYQTEGGWNADDKGESIWDYLTHTHPEHFKEGANGDVATDSYHLWKTDVQLLRELNINVYRFSISWTRILPNGYMNYVSKSGIQYYNNLINELLRYNITPVVTIYHWDLPQRLQELGGWTNPEIINNFIDFAKLLFQSFGDRVKFWYTFNEPLMICEWGYGGKAFAPGLNFPGIPVYLCGHNLLKAHAEVYHLYYEQFQKQQQGTISIAMVTPWFTPKKNIPDDIEAVDLALQFRFGWFSHPIFSKEGNYPQVMIDRINKLSKEQGFKRSRLPTFTAEEVKRIRGTSDFFGINYYKTNKVTKNDKKNSAQYPIPSNDHDRNVIVSKNRSDHLDWIETYGEGLFDLLKYIKKEYNDPPVIITENGVDDINDIYDKQRISYIRTMLKYILNAMDSGVNVKGYFYWSVMDNFEWTSGYTSRYGLYYVDFKDPNRKRIAKESARVYGKICKTGQIDYFN